ncbi:MAG: lysylphosphatidylglycerol synthase transmembrane domain-containing protein [Bacteroidia bacterium]
MKQILNTVKFTLILAIGIGLLLLAFRGVDVDSAMKEIAGADFFWLFMSILVSLAAFFSRAYRWNMLIDTMGYRPKMANTSTALMIGYLANLAVPRLGEVTRCGTLTREEKIPFEKLIGTVILERLIDVLCLLACMVFTAFSEKDKLGNFLNENIFDPAKAKVQGLLHSPLLLAGVVLVFLLLVIWVFRKKKSSSAESKFTKILKGVTEGMVAIKKLKSPFWFLFHTAFIWVMYFLMSFLCFKSLEHTAQLDWHAGMFVLVAGAMGMSAPVNGGVGTYHILVSQGLIIYGVAKEHGIAFATLMHGTQTLIVIILGGLSFLYLFLRERKLNAKQS